MNYSILDWDLSIVRSSSLMGRDLMKKFHLDWTAIGSQILKVSTSVDTLTQEFQNYEARSQFKEDAGPRFLKARLVTFALLSKVDNWTQWCSKECSSKLIIPIELPFLSSFPSQMGKLELLEISTPPSTPNSTSRNIPPPHWMNYLLACLEDKSNAYHQLPFAPECKKFLAVSTH